MALTITDSRFIEKKILKVDSKGIKFTSGVIGGSKRFAFNQIAYILLSRRSDLLSIQVGQEILDIRIKPGKKKHEKVIEELVRAVRATKA